MEQEKPKSISIEIEKLHFDTQNPRFQSLENEREALHALCGDRHARKTVALAEDISRRGLNPSEVLVVIADNSIRNGHYIVVEGNRRLAALKLLSVPTRAEESPLSSALAAKIKKASITATQNGTLGKVACSLLPDRESAAHWISLKHTGENDGVGVVPWNGEEVARFRGMNNASLHLLDYVKEHGTLSNEATQGITKFSISNLSRLLADPSVRNAIGIITKPNGDIFTTKKEEEFLRVATKIVDDIASKAITVSAIKGKNDRKDYISSISSLLPSKEDIEEPIQINAKQNTSSEKNASTALNDKSNIKQKSIHPGLSRAQLIPKKLKAEIYISRISEVFTELKNLDVQKFTNASTALLRVLIDTTTHEYIDKFGLKIERDKNGQTDLRPRIAAVLQDCQEKSQPIREPFNAAKNALLQPTGPIHLDKLHIGLHGRYEHPQPENLLRGWDAIQEWFIIMWKLLNEKHTTHAE